MFYLKVQVVLFSYSINMLLILKNVTSSEALWLEGAIMSHDRRERGFIKHLSVLPDILLATYLF